jgi:hypothetical protein
MAAIDAEANVRKRDASPTGVLPSIVMLNLNKHSCVPLACRECPDKGRVDRQLLEKIGSPGRTRTCDNTVMSGRKKPGEPQKSEVFDANR